METGLHLELFVERPAPRAELVRSKHLSLISWHGIEDVEQSFLRKLGEVSGLQSWRVVPIALRHLHRPRLIQSMTESWHFAG
jgi:hypothetical protein